MSIKLSNQVQKIEERLAALEAAFSRPECTCKQDLEKMKNDIQGIKMRMGRKE